MKNSHQPLHLGLAGIFGFAVASLTALYAVVLAVGLITLPNPGESIRDPWFTLMELLILSIAPCMVAFTTGARALAPSESQGVALLAIAFMIMCAATTSIVHFSILTLSHLPDFQDSSWSSLVFGFRWPSVAYAIDILAWDVFFPLSALCTAASLRSVAAFKGESRIFIVASLLAFAGLAGVPLAIMEVRNIGIVGYVLFYPLGAAMVSYKLWIGARAIAA